MRVGHKRFVMGQSQWNVLLQYQIEELALYVSGPVRRKPSTNLIRRNLLMRVGVHGASEFALTERGRATLIAHIQSRGG